MLYVSFISAPGFLVAAAGLVTVTPLRPCPDAHVSGAFPWSQTLTGPYARPPAPKLLQLLIDLVHVAPPTYTLLPLLPSAPAASAVPNWNALPLRCRNCP